MIILLLLKSNTDFFNHFQDIDLEAKHLAIDKPTKKLLQFMWKHYQLSKLVNQGNNFVIFEEFFDEACENFTYLFY